MVLSIPVAFLVAWLVAEAFSLALLWLGSRWADRRWLRRLGQVALRRKMKAIDRYWPLTRLRPAIERDDTFTCTLILASLIVLKSVLCFLLGFIALLWLPVASVVVPSIVAEHDSSDPSLVRWVQKVSVLQVTSHVLAAAMGFALVFGAWANGRPIVEGLVEHTAWVVAALAGSLALAIAAGFVEARGVIARGI